MASGNVEILNSGLVDMSVCAPSSLTQAEVEEAANIQSGTGIASAWHVSDEGFADGRPSPSACEMKPGFTHWHLVC